MYAGFAEKIWALYWNAGHHVTENIFSLMLSKWAKFHPTNRSKIYYSQSRRQNFAAGGQKSRRHI